MDLLAHARIVMWEGAGLWVVDAAPAVNAGQRRTGFHAHHAIQVTFGLGGRFTLETSAGGKGGEAVAVAADVQHLFEAEGLAAHIFVEPESRLGRAAARRLLGEATLTAVLPELLGDFRARLVANFRAAKRDNAELIAMGRALVAAFAGDTRADVPDLRVRKLIAWAGQQLHAPVSLADAVAIGGLSASRLRHLFVEQTGLPFKTYLLWLR